MHNIKKNEHGDDKQFHDKFLNNFLFILKSKLQYISPYVNEKVGF